MKKCANRIISFILVFSFILSLGSTVFAAEATTADTASQNVTQEEIALAKEAYNTLSPEAKAIFNSSLASDVELLEFHLTYIDPSFVAPPATRAAGAAALVATELTSLGLPTTVVYAFKAMAASMVAAIADGPLPIGDILLAASTAAVVGTVALNWSKVAPKWSKIVDVFKKAFSDTVDNVINAFDSLKADAEKEAESESADRINDVLKGKTKDRTTSGNTNIYEGDGGDKQAEEDFDKLTEGSSTTTYSNGTKVGELPDGTKVNVRTKSSDGRTTLEIQGTGKFKIKIRYN